MLAHMHTKAGRPKGGMALCSAVLGDNEAMASGALGGSL